MIVSRADAVPVCTGLRPSSKITNGKRHAKGIAIGKDQVRERLLVEDLDKFQFSTFINDLVQNLKDH